ncbi:hypothetical protein ACOMHN_011503 [Nucella lapillus]
MTLVIMRQMKSAESTINIYFTAVAAMDLMYLCISTLPQWITYFFNFRLNTTHDVVWEICAFFIVFYILLLSYWCAMISFYFQTVSLEKPYLIGDKSLLSTPGLGVRPLAKTKANTGYSSLIQYKLNSTELTKEPLMSLHAALKPYRKAYRAQYATFWKNCNQGDTPSVLQSCIIYYTHLITDKGCDAKSHYGYKEGKPCVFLHINNAYGWKADPYTSANKKMPKDLQDSVRRYYQNGTQINMPHLVWVYCDGEDDLDKEFLGKDIQYFPSQGFRTNYFPYLNQNRHLTPAIMVKFNSLTANIIVKVDCFLYAKNIEIDKKQWIGGFHFELFVDTS